MYKDSIHLQTQTFALTMWSSRFFFIALAITFSTLLHAQQLPNFTQYRFYNALNNPAAISSNYMAFEQNGSIGASYRVQWQDVIAAPKTFVLQGDYLIDNGSGVSLLTGGHVINDQTGLLSTTGVYGKIGGVISSRPERGGFCVALTAGLAQLRVNSAEIRLRDPDDLTAQQNLTSMYPDVGVGIFAYQQMRGRNVKGDFLYGGVSVPQVIGSTASIVDDEGAEFSIKRNQHIYGNIGYLHYFWNDSFIEPSVWVKYVPNAPINVDANIRYFFDESLLWIGAGGSSSRAAHVEFGVMLGDNIGYENNLQIGYGYDYSFNSFGPSVGGTHELNVSYVFGR